MMDNEHISPETDAGQGAEVPYIEYGGVDTRNAPRPPALPASQPVMPVQPVSLPAPSLTVAHEPAPRQQKYSAVTITLLALIIALVVIGSSGLAYFALVVHPREMQARASSVASTVLASQAQGTAASQARATATFTAMSPQQLYTWATSGTPVLSDPLTTRQGSDWYQGGTTKFGCMFMNGAYHAFAGAGFESTCPSYDTFFHNLAFQARATVITGDGGGLIFDITPHSYYLFEAFENSTFALVDYDTASAPVVLISGRTVAFNTGANQSNVLTIIDINGHIYLYINQQPVDQTYNNANTSGQIGLAGDSSTVAANVAFNDLKVWNL